MQDLMENNSVFKKSAIVVAHPDDEVLWFSSILDKVDTIIICYLGDLFNCEISKGREKVLDNYPFENLSALKVDEAGVFNKSEWRNPVPTKYGLTILDKERNVHYRKNYDLIKKKLAQKMNGFDNIFTHNPWGEYGNEEHVQLYNIVNELRGSLKFNIWFSNYFSSKSSLLMSHHLHRMSGPSITLETNEIFTSELKGIYQKSNCWTWYDDWVPFDKETFFTRQTSKSLKTEYGGRFTMNCIIVRPQEKLRKKNWFKRNFMKFFTIK